MKKLFMPSLAASLLIAFGLIFLMEFIDWIN